jgi:hypothetical protein
LLTLHAPYDNLKTSVNGASTIVGYVFWLICWDDRLNTAICIAGIGGRDSKKRKRNARYPMSKMNINEESTIWGLPSSVLSVALDHKHTESRIW